MSNLSLFNEREGFEQGIGCGQNVSVCWPSTLLSLTGHLRLLDIWCTYHFKRDEEGGWELDEEGCPTVCKHENMEAHERQCDYAWASCPYSKVSMFIFNTNSSDRSARYGRRIWRNTRRFATTTRSSASFAT